MVFKPTPSPFAQFVVRLAQPEHALYVAVFNAIASRVHYTRFRHTVTDKLVQFEFSANEADMWEIASVVHNPVYTGGECFRLHGHTKQNKRLAALLGPYLWCFVSAEAYRKCGSHVPDVKQTLGWAVNGVSGEMYSHDHMLQICQNGGLYAGPDCPVAFYDRLGSPPPEEVCM